MLSVYKCLVFIVIFLLINYVNVLGNMTVQFIAQQAISHGYSSVVAKVTLLFRKCYDGEILVNNQCEECPFGSYSLHFSETAVVSTLSLICIQ